MLILFNVGSEQVLQLIYSTFLSIWKYFRLCYSVVSFAIFFNIGRFNDYFNWNIMKLLSYPGVLSFCDSLSWTWLEVIL